MACMGFHPNFNKNQVPTLMYQKYYVAGKEDYQMDTPTGFGNPYTGKYLQITITETSGPNCIKKIIPHPLISIIKSRSWSPLSRLDWN